MHNKLKNMHAIFIATHTQREQPTLTHTLYEYNE